MDQMSAIRKAQVKLSSNSERASWRMMDLEDQAQMAETAPFIFEGIRYVGLLSRPRSWAAFSDLISPVRMQTASFLQASMF